MEQFSEFFLNNLILFVALGIVLFLLARTWVSQGNIKSIRPLQAVQLSNHDEAVFVDVRTNDEYKQGHILGAIHIPLGFFESRSNELKDFKEQAVIVCCKSGNRSMQAASQLNKAGFTDLYNLSGGVLSWQSANLPLTTEPTKKDQVKAKKPKKKKSTQQEVAESQHSVEDKTSADEALQQDSLQDSLQGNEEKDSVQQNEQQQTIDAENPVAELETKPSEEIGDTTKIVVYRTPFCPYCQRAVKLLQQKGVEYEEIDIEQSPEAEDEMIEKAQSDSVPQIFIDGTHVGGCDELYALDKDDQLDDMLGIATVTQQ